ncbi:MAG: UDP-4-amino-4,6-dideoxy-N-acetyl-beta-L-altrosamine transaminase [Pseudomonadales bacterium]|nr:UDP-4-amino-4,6-dideoxy-N-acetyl-beta-L-altrosamine transaminase [Pseudomonadales bacterium]
MIPYGKQDISQDDIDAVVDVLQSDFLTQGPKVPEFESAICQHTGSQYATATNSATSALHIACLALGLGKGDWLWTSPITFVASANCGLYCDAEVDFVDIDPKTYNLCPEALERKLKKAKTENKLPKIVIPVHLCGQSCDMQAIRKLSDEYGFKIIEDASHAIGGKYQDTAVGSCQYSDITVFSFHPVKIVTTAEGGAATTNCSKIHEKLELFRSHGVTRKPELMTHAPDGPWYYQQVELGYNYRMTELQAALGISQITRLEEFVNQRHKLAMRYNDKLANLPVTLPFQHPDSYSGLHLFVIRLQLEDISKDRKTVFTELRESGIAVNVHYIPVHLQPYYQQKGFNAGDYPHAEQYYAEAISLPMFPLLSDSDQDIVCSTLSNILTS